MDANLPWRNPLLSLGARCVLLAKHEMQSFAPIAYGGPNTSPRVREYFAPCLRDLNGDGVTQPTERLGLTEGNWCAAFASWCMLRCWNPNESLPHQPRAGVVEIVADAQKAGLYHTRDEVLDGKWTPHVGDLVIWDRSERGKPETSWWRHVNRIASWSMTDPAGPRFTTIGGNETRGIRIAEQPPKSLTQSKLIGFVSYFQRPQQVTLSRDEAARNLALTAAFVEAHRRTL